MRIENKVLTVSAYGYRDRNALKEVPVAGRTSAGHNRKRIGYAGCLCLALAFAVSRPGVTLGNVAVSEGKSDIGIGRESLSLNGTWKIVFDSDNLGKQEEWGRRFPSDSVSIHVPSVWNEIRPNYQGVAWYQTSFLAPPRWKSKSVRIRFGAVSYLAEVWLNGKYLGSHEGGYTPFELEASEALVWEQQNQLVVRVLLPMRTREFIPGLKWEIGKPVDGFVLEETPTSKQTWYDNYGGIWQDVQVVVTNPVWVRDCFIQPDIHAQKIDVQCELSNLTGKEQRITLALAVAEKNQPTIEKSQQTKDVVLANGTQSFDMSLKIPEAKLWSPGQPFLYGLEVRLISNNEAIDSRPFTFGMREFTIREHQFYLNGRPIIVKAAIYQPHYPQTLAYPPYEEMLANDIRMAKEANFNMFRLHILPHVPRFLDLADELGILLWAEPPIGWIQKSPQMRDRCRREVRETIARDRNHPAIVMWGVLNEAAAQGLELKNELATYAHELDPTRLVFDDSGDVYWSGEDARVYVPYQTSPRPISDTHPYLAQPFDLARFNYYRQMAEPHRLTFVSEFGAMGGVQDLDAVIGKYPPGRRWQDKERLEEIYGIFRKGFLELGLDKAFGNFAAFAKSSREAQATTLTRMIDALRLNPLTAGYDICHWNDASWELSYGFLDEWRNPKPELAAAAAANKPLHIIVSTARANYYAGESTDVELTIVNDEGASGKAEVRLRIETLDGKVLQEQAVQAEMKTRVQALGRLRPVAPLAEGSYRLSATLNLEGKLVDRTEHEILVLKRIPRQGGAAIPVSILDPDGRLAARLSNFPMAVTAYGAHKPPQNVYMVAANADSFLDYPLGQLKGLAELARQGSTLILFELPLDTNEVVEKLGVLPMAVKISASAVPDNLGALQWIRAHPITDGLPSNIVLDQRYAEILPARLLETPADEVVAGLLVNAFGDYGRRWVHSLVITPVGKGHVIFCQLRLLDNLTKDPLADRLFMNLVRYADSIARKPDAPLGQKQQETFEQEVANRKKQIAGEIQRWAVIGPFNNQNRIGLGLEYPPEVEFSYGASYPGKNGNVSWKPATAWSSKTAAWISSTTLGYRVNLGGRFDDWTVAYAYTQIYSPKKTETRFKLTCQQGCRLWLNGRELVHSEVLPPNENVIGGVELRPGWNPVLVKVDRTQMVDSFFILDVRSGSGEALADLRFDFAGELPKARPTGDSRQVANKP